MKDVAVTVVLRVEDDDDPAEWDWLELLDMTADEFKGIMETKVLRRNIPPPARK